MQERCSRRRDTFMVVTRIENSEIARKDLKVKPVAKELPLTGNHETQDVVVVEVPRERLSIALKAECFQPEHFVMSNGS